MLMVLDHQYGEAILLPVKNQKKKFFLYISHLYSQLDTIIK